MRLEVVNPLSHPGWDDLLLASGGGSFFHSSAWARVLHESYGYTPLYFTSFAGGRIETLVPVMEIDSPLTGKRGVSLPFTDYCDPIIPESADAGDVVGQIITYGKSAGWRHFEFRGDISLPPETPASEAYYGHVLDISRDVNTLLSALRDSTRRNIRKAGKEGVRVGISGSRDSVEEFYRLHCVTRKLHGVPPQPYRFFRKIHEHCICAGYGTVAIARHEGRAVAGGVYFHFGGGAIYKYGASVAAMRRLRANNLVMWEAIRHYADLGCARFCMGRTDADDPGLLQFKRGWGASPHAIRYYRYDIAAGAYVKTPSALHGLHNKVLAGMPVPVLRLAGSLLYRHVG